MASKSVKKETIRWRNKRGEPSEAERWVARYRDEAGKQRKKNFDRRVDAQRWLDETTASIVTGRYVDPNAGKITLAQFYNDWGERQIWLENSRENADQAMVVCTFKDVPLKNIRRSHVESWVKHMTTTLKSTTIKTRFVHVRAVLRAAVADKMITEDPSDGVKLPAQPSREELIIIPSPEDVGDLIAHADQKKRVSTRVGFEAYVALCAFAGLRKAEALAVQVSDIDFLRRELHIKRQIQRAKPREIEAGKGIIASTRGVKAVVRPPKYGSVRTVAIPDELIGILSSHIAQYTPDGESSRWMFTDAEGRPYNDNSITWKWRGTRKAAGLTTNLHHLRHFYASGLIAAGCDVVTVQRAMGHKSPTTTLNDYAHLWPNANDRTRAAASQLAKLALTGYSTGRTPGAKGLKALSANQPNQHPSPA